MLAKDRHEKLKLFSSVPFFLMLSIERALHSMAPPVETPPQSIEQTALEVARDYVHNAANVDILVRYLRENDVRLM
jgi:hypothetical protein